MMSLNITAHQAGSYQVATQVYEGPLDLLLQLIEHAELDITKLALAQVTDQYLEHLRQLKEHAAEEVSAFLVIAARLIQIKSEALLPRPPLRAPGEEDPGEALALQLIIYKRFRRIADFLKKREESGLQTFLRLAPPPRAEGKIDLSDVTLNDLLMAANQVFTRNDGRPALNTVVAFPRITIREKIHLILQLLKNRGRATFQILLGRQRSRLDMVVTFLAMLELIKRRMIDVHQDTLFGDIEIETSESWEENDEFDLEFGE
ncbi:MAG: segregation and condensation protein A [Omnitrophica WOR_2 bacterium]